MNRTQAIRKYYLWLHKGSSDGVRDCPMTDHPLYEWRLGHKPENPRLPKPHAIRAHCLDCTGNSYRAVSECPFPECPLWEFRSGRRETTPYLTVSDTETGSEGKSTTRALKPQNLAL